MRVLIWLLRAALFVLLLVFAARNNAIVTVRFLFGASWQLPLNAVILIFFAAGTGFGVLVALARLARERRERIRARDELDRLRNEAGRAPRERSRAS